MTVWEHHPCSPRKYSLRDPLGLGERHHKDIFKAWISRSSWVERYKHSVNTAPCLYAQHLRLFLSFYLLFPKRNAMCPLKDFCIMNFLAEVNSHHFYIPNIPLLTGLNNTVRVSMLKGLKEQKNSKLSAWLCFLFFQWMSYLTSFLSLSAPGLGLQILL